MWLKCAACDKYTIFPGTFTMAIKPKVSHSLKARRLYLDGREPTPVLLEHRIYYSDVKCMWCRTKNRIHITWQATIDKSV